MRLIEWCGREMGNNESTWSGLSFVVPLLNSSCGIHQAINKTCSQVFTCTVQVVTELESQKRQVLEGCHSDELRREHFGQDKTLAKVSERYYWLGMVNDVKEFCRTFDKCQRANRYSYSVIKIKASIKLVSWWSKTAGNYCERGQRWNQTDMAPTEFMRSSERAHSNCAVWMTARKKSWHKYTT